MTVHEIPSGPGMPKTIGPYSHVVRGGDFLFVSGQPGLNVETGEVAGPGFEPQARQAFENVARVLRAAGSDMSRVVKVTVYLADPNAFAKLNELFAEFFPAKPPARATPIVALPRGLLISIECIALA
jgi:2-iminobutanoate/2-iminopropanoate deaminase